MKKGREKMSFVAEKNKTEMKSKLRCRSEEKSSIIFGCIYGPIFVLFTDKVVLLISC